MSSGTVESRTNRAARLLKHCGVELIVLDEFDHLFDVDRAKVMTKASQWLKVLIVNTGLPVVVCGMPEAEYVLSAEHTERRFKQWLTLRRFPWRTPQGQREFCGMLKKLDETLPLAGDIRFGERRLGRPVLSGQPRHFGVRRLVAALPNFARLSLAGRIPPSPGPSVIPDKRKPKRQGKRRQVVRTPKSACPNLRALSRPTACAGRAIEPLHRRPGQSGAGPGMVGSSVFRLPPAAITAGCSATPGRIHLLLNSGRAKAEVIEAVARVFA